MNLLRNGRPLIMAHRGDSAAVPENTLLSFRRAVEIGIDFLESDVRLSKDDEPILFHDDNLRRVTGEAGAIRDMTLEELREIDLGYAFSPDGGKSFPYRDMNLRVVTLREAFQSFPDVRFNLDIKDDDIEAPSILAEAIKENDRQDSVVVGSFHNAQARRFRNLMPDVKTAASPSEVTRFVFSLKMRALGLFSKKRAYEAFQVPIKYGWITVVSKRFVRAAHERDVAVHVWTVNERDVMAYLYDLGVDGIFTDKPAILKSLLRDLGAL
jgi:glycerophosphoryl diester phosphodiesterase